MNNELVTQVFLDITKVQSMQAGGFLKFRRWNDEITVEFAREPMMAPIFVVHMTEAQFQGLKSFMNEENGIIKFITKEYDNIIFQIPRAVVE
jgi:hypothetical protein